MSNTIIECRNKDANIVVGNGDWTTILEDKNLLIEENDQIYVKSTFIDTQASSQNQIVIPEDINLTIEYGFYRAYIVNTGLEAYPNTVLNPIDYKDYTLTLEIISSNPNNKLVYDYSFVKFNKKLPTKAVSLELSYFNFENIQQGVIVNLPANFDGDFFAIKQIIGNIITTQVNNTNIEIVSPPIDVLQDFYNWNLYKTNFVPCNGNTVHLPYTQTKTINLPKGNYDPDDLCTYINYNFTKISDTGVDYITGINDILQSSAGIQNQFRDGSGNTVEFSLTSETLNPIRITSMRDFPNHDSIYFGTNQFELSFSSISKKFQFDYTHMPYYYQKQLAVSIIPVQGSQTEFITHTGGIYLRNLFSYTVNGNKSFDFWNGLLGFDNSILTSFDYDKPTSGNLTNHFMPIVYNLDNPNDEGYKEGVRITTGKISLDSVIDKDTPTQTPSTQINSSIAPTDTVPIQSVFSLLDNQNNFGYYIIEIGNSFKNDFYSIENNHRNFQSIVSKYYSIDSYTTGSTEGSLIYTHKGEPLILDSFKCRILDSNKNVAQNIGDDNTIHIAIRKAPKEEITEQLKKK